MLLLSALVIASFAGDVSPTEKPDKSGITDPFVVDCKRSGDGIEVWAGNKTSSSYSKVKTDSDGFTTRITLRQQPYQKGDKTLPDMKCSARYRFFRITEFCGDVRVMPSGDYGKIDGWKVNGPDDCAATGVSSWMACGNIRGINKASICVTTYYCPDLPALRKTEMVTRLTSPRTL
jgi:hypothetical protein